MCSTSRADGALRETAAQICGPAIIHHRDIL